MTTEEKENKEIIIRLSDLKDFLLGNKWRIGLTGMLFALLGWAYSYTLPIEYASGVQILPELQSKNNLGGFRALADLAGMNLDNLQISEAIRPDLYPSVIESKLFLLDVAKLKVTASDSRQAETISGFLERKGTGKGGLLDKLVGLFNIESEKDKDATTPRIPTNIPASILILDKSQEALLKQLAARITSNLDRKTGVISIRVTMPDPIVAAWVAQYSTEYLENYMLTYRLGKQHAHVEFLEREMEKASANFRNADEKLRRFKDRNRNPFIESSTTDESRLQAEFNLNQNLYTELSKQYEQSKIKMKDESPVIKILNPAEVPLKRDSPKRRVIASVFLVAGLVTGVAWSFFRKSRRS